MEGRGLGFEIICWQIAWEARMKEGKLALNLVGRWVRFNTLNTLSASVSNDAIFFDQYLGFPYVQDPS